MSVSYTKRKKSRKRRLEREIVRMEFNLEPSERLRQQYPGKDDKYILEATRALVEYNRSIKNLIRKGKISRYILMKDGKGRPLFRGTYKFEKSGEKVTVGRWLPQKFVGYEMLKTAREQVSGK